MRSFSFPGSTSVCGVFFPGRTWVIICTRSSWKKKSPHTGVDPGKLNERTQYWYASIRVISSLSIFFNGCMKPFINHVLVSCHHVYISHFSMHVYSCCCKTSSQSTFTSHIAHRTTIECDCLINYEKSFVACKTSKDKSALINFIPIIMIKCKLSTTHRMKRDGKCR